MTQIYVTQLPNGKVGIIHLAPARIINRADFQDSESFDDHVAAAAAIYARRLPKTMFELSRTSDIGHFNSATDTLAAIALGLPGHVPLECVEMDDVADLPADRSRRDDWEISNGKVRVKPA